MSNILIIGANSQLAQNFINEHGKEYSNIFGVDVQGEASIQKIHYIQIDIMKIEEMNKISQYIKRYTEHIDNVIFFSAVNFMNDFYTLNENDWEVSLKVNITSILFILKEIYQLFSNKVAIVLVASQNGIVGHEKRIDYGVSKAALIHLTKQLSVDFSQDISKDIRVNAVSPSYIVSERNKEFLRTWYGKKLLNRIPYKKFVEATDVSAVIRFLLSEESKAVRGHNLVVDYGYTIV
ncbi:MAG: SDR family oxidoreductase [Ligilactobacillus agilis]|uniref:SDR family oxidoreductase n=1 Tax=Ligilactobacillus agilis TaxID=1601 RepID=UPI00243194D0|nr:SDR family oxidoreductase [Ligilactobacillus agilis]MCI5761412.1 SDR family oxidoreductase [Ligilactobacillus agilis]MCL8204319.1 SDR family oxidoreductase [Ligilactobacillus agilis]